MWSTTVMTSRRRMMVDSSRHAPFVAVVGTTTPLTMIGSVRSISSLSTLLGPSFLSRSSNINSRNSSNTMKMMISLVGGTTRRSIAIGTDMMSTVISLQKARPWYSNPDEGSNQAIDNAVTLTELFDKNKTVLVFGVPAPFTGTCTLHHYPPYQQHATALIAAGCDTIVCYAVSDPNAHDAWSRLVLNNDPTQIIFLADPDASFAKAYGLEHDYSHVSLGLRSKRFSMLVVNGIVQVFRIVDDAAGDAAFMLQALQEINESK